MIIGCRLICKYPTLSQFCCITCPLSNSRNFSNKVDFLILSENPGVSLHEWVNATNPGQVIITAANSKWNIKRWEKELDSLPLRCFSIANRGAFIE